MSEWHKGGRAVRWSCDPQQATTLGVSRCRIAGSRPARGRRGPVRQRERLGQRRLAPAGRARRTASGAQRVHRCLRGRTWRDQSRRNARRNAASPGACGGCPRQSDSRMTLILDAGALVAAERNDREVVALIKAAMVVGIPPVSHGGVVGQVWRGGRGRQANLARLLPGVDIVSLDERAGKDAGVLLARSDHSDVIDAAVVLLASDGDEILTSDPDDLVPLARAADLHVDIIPV